MSNSNIPQDAINKIAALKAQTSNAGRDENTEEVHGSIAGAMGKYAAAVATDSYNDASRGREIMAETQANSNIEGLESKEQLAAALRSEANDRMTAEIEREGRRIQGSAASRMQAAAQKVERIVARENVNSLNEDLPPMKE